MEQVSGPLSWSQGGEESVEDEEVQGLWDRHGVSTEYVEQCRDYERDVLTTTSAIGRPVPSCIRTTALQFMMQVTTYRAKGQELWLQAVSLLDVYFQKAVVDIEMLPATCVCMMRLVSKLDCAMLTDLDTWLPLAHDMTRQLARSGVRAPEITQEMLDSHERVIWGAFDGQMRGMNVNSWFMIFSERFRLLSQDHYKNHVPLTHLLVWSEAATPQFSHFDHACGLFFIGLVETDLIPLDSIYSPALRLSLAEAAFWQTMLQGSPRRNVYTEDQCNSILRMLEIVTCSGQSALQHAAQRVVQCLARIAMQQAIAT